MSAGKVAKPVFCIVLMLVLAATGCTSTITGDVTYRNGTISIPLENTGEPQDAFVQVTVYEIKDLQQQQIMVLQTPVYLRQGHNEILVPGTLPPGTYKLYVYLLNPGERQTATIRDIVVQPRS
jgi:hypothetical protein